MRTLAASVLGFEAFIALFFGLASFGLHIDHGWQVAVVLGACAILLAGMLRRAWAYRAGWVLQVALIATGFMVTAMFVLGVIFLALWWTALHYGAKADRIRAAQLAAIAEAEAGDTPAAASPDIVRQGTGQEVRNTDGEPSGEPGVGGGVAGIPAAGIPTSGIPASDNAASG